MPARLKSRKFWVTLIAQVTAIAVLFVPEYSDQLAQAANHIGGILLMGLTAFGYVAAQGKVDQDEQRFKVFKDSETATVHISGGIAIPAPTQATVAGGGVSMTNPSKPLLIGWCLLMAWGCASTPEGRWYQQRLALTAANSVFLIHSHNLTNSEILEYGDLLQNGRSLLEQSRLLLPSGGPGFDDYLILFEKVLIDLAEIQKELPDDPIGNIGSASYLQGALQPRRDAVQKFAGGWRFNGRRARGNHESVRLVRGPGRRIDCHRKKTSRVQHRVAA